jgi:hypothetical protein
LLLVLHPHIFLTRPLLEEAMANGRSTAASLQQQRRDRCSKDAPVCFIFDAFIAVVAVETDFQQ